MKGCLKSHTHAHTHGRSLKRTSRQKYFVCQLQTCLLSLSLSPSEVQNTREQREKLRGRREGGRGERERETDGHEETERKQERMKMSDLMLLSACQDFQSTASLIGMRGGWNVVV